MYLNHFSSTGQAKLNQILHTLDQLHGVKINIDLDSPVAEKVLQECQRTYQQAVDKIINESAFNSYQQNPNYVKSILILEAVKIMLTEIAPKRRRRKMNESTMEADMTSKPTISMQLSAIAAKVPQGSQESAAFANALDNIAEKLAGKQPLDQQEQEILDWIKSLPKPISVATIINDGVPLYGTKLASSRQANIKKEYPFEEDLEIMKARTETKSNPGLDNVHEAGDDKDGDGDNDFADVMIARMVASGVPLPQAIAKVKNKSYNKESMLSEDEDTELTRTPAHSGVLRQVQHYEYQASMARSELYRNAKYAMSMIKQVDPMGEVPPWVAGALTKAANYLDKIYHYLDYYTKFEPEQLPEDMDTDMELGETSGGVTRQNLMMIVEYSTKLFHMIQPGDKLEGWVAMKLTTASECVSSCKHYMDYLQFENHALDDHFSEGRRQKEKKLAESRAAKILNEDLELAKAQSIITAKSLSNKVQDMAERLAKISVEELMPLVAMMREQFGPEASDAFNQTMKETLDKLLDLTTETKEQMDQAIDTISSGGVPSVPADIEKAGEETGEEAPADDTDITSDLEQLDKETEEEPGEPLGRAKKDELAEAAKPKRQKCTECGIGMYEADKKGKMKCNECGAVMIAEAKQAKEPGAVATAKVLKMGGKFVASDKKSLTKMGIKKRDEIIKAIEREQTKESTVNEVAPPGEEAEAFIKGNKEEFKKRYGKNWESRLYATAWKQFGPKKESYTTAEKILETAKLKQIQLDEKLVQHKKEFAQSVKAKKVSDPLKIGYGLEGESIIQEMKRNQAVIQQAKESMKKELHEGVIGILKSISTLNKVRNIENIKNQTPYGVSYLTKGGRKTTKMFENAETRDYWLGLRGDTINHVQLINPDTLDKLILETKKG